MVAFALGMRAWRTWQAVLACERLFVVADGQMERNQWDEATATLDTCLAMNPLYFPAYEAKALILLDVKRDERAALVALTSGLPHLEHDPRLHRAIGELYLRSLRDHAKAREHLQRACELDPDDYTARGLLQRANAKDTLRG